MVVRLIILLGIILFGININAQITFGGNVFRSTNHNADDYYYLFVTGKVKNALVGVDHMHNNNTNIEIQRAELPNDESSQYKEWGYLFGSSVGNKIFDIDAGARLVLGSFSQDVTELGTYGGLLNVQLGNFLRFTLKLIGNDSVLFNLFASSHFSNLKWERSMLDIAKLDNSVHKFSYLRTFFGASITF